MMMSLGLFVFGLPTLAYEALQRQSAWRHPSNERIGARPAYQYVGPGEDTMTLTGRLIPELAGSTGSLALLRRMADAGRAYMMVDGRGYVYGAWVITGLDEAHSEFLANGQAQRVEFTLSLTSVTEDEARVLLDDLDVPISRLDGSVLDWGLA